MFVWVESDERLEYRGCGLRVGAGRVTPAARRSGLRQGKRMENAILASVIGILVRRDRSDEPSDRARALGAFVAGAPRLSFDGV